MATIDCLLAYVLACLLARFRIIYDDFNTDRGMKSDWVGRPLFHWIWFSPNWKSDITIASSCWFLFSASWNSNSIWIMNYWTSSLSENSSSLLQLRIEGHPVMRCSLFLISIWIYQSFPLFLMGNAQHFEFSVCVLFILTGFHSSGTHSHHIRPSQHGVRMSHTFLTWQHSVELTFEWIHVNFQESFPNMPTT
jgi:hypothetical protein